MKAKHTPSPWKIDESTKHLGDFILSGDIPICSTFSKGKSLEEKEANGKLICAAPEMLKQLRIAEQILRSYGLMLQADKIAKTIKKATEVNTPFKYRKKEC